MCLADDFSPEESLDIQNVVTRGLKKVWTGNYTGEFPREFWEVTVKKLNEAVDMEFGKAYKPLANQLKYQNSVFAAFKSKNQTQTLENLKAASKAATFTDFAVEVDGVVKDYNINHLKAEWNTAKKAARSAKRWAKAVEDSDLFPNFKYLPSTAKEPRDKHKPFYGIILALNDPKVDEIIAPSDWGCQCGWTTTDEKVTGFPKGAPEPEPGLDNNPGKDGALISPSHPHIKGNQSKAAAILKSNIAQVYEIDESEIIEFYHSPKTNGCYFSVEELYKKERVTNKRIAKVFADKGHLVELHGQNSIDSIVDGAWNEFKSPRAMTFNAFDKELQRANRQLRSRGLIGDVTFELPGGYDKKIIRTALRNRLGRDDFECQIVDIHFVTEEKYIGKCSVEDALSGKLPI